MPSNQPGRGRSGRWPLTPTLIGLLAIAGIACKRSAPAAPEVPPDATVPAPTAAPIPAYAGPWPCRLPPAAASHSLHIPLKWKPANFGGALLAYQTDNQGIQTAEPSGDRPCSSILRRTERGRVEEEHSRSWRDSAGRKLGDEGTYYRAAEGTDLPPPYRSVWLQVIRAGDALLAQRSGFEEHRPDGDRSGEAAVAWCRDEHGLVVEKVEIPDASRPKATERDFTVTYDYDARRRPRSFQMAADEDLRTAPIHLKWSDRNALVEERMTKDSAIGSSEYVATFSWDDESPPRLTGATIVNTDRLDPDAGGPGAPPPPPVVHRRVWKFERDAQGRIIRATFDETRQHSESTVYTFEWAGHRIVGGTETETRRDGRVHRQTSSLSERSTSPHHDAQGRRTYSSFDDNDGAKSEEWYRYECPDAPPPTRG